jgi:hypothetical protein
MRYEGYGGLDKDGEQVSLTLTLRGTKLTAPLTNLSKRTGKNRRKILFPEYYGSKKRVTHLDITTEDGMKIGSVELDPPMVLTANCQAFFATGALRIVGFP